MKKPFLQHKDQDPTTQEALRLMLSLLGFVVAGICVFFALTYNLHVR